jgi:HEAT repeat protein
MMPKFSKEIRDADPQLSEILHMWKESNLDALTQRMHSQAMAEQGLAAFALGDLQTPKAVDVLIDTFLDTHTPGDTRWAVTDAMTLLDPAIIMRRAVQPLLDERSAREAHLSPETWSSRSKWYERLAYLIGKIGAPESAARDFLDRCLFEFSDVGAKARAIMSFGELLDRRHKDLFEEIALGGFSRIADGKRLSEREATYLRRMAVEALANIGDEATLARLRAQRMKWPQEVEKAFYWTSEEIFWRMTLSAER